MRRVRISDEENRAILADKFGDGMGDLAAGQQKIVIKRLFKVLDSSSPQHFLHHETLENCEELQTIRAGDKIRIHCRLVMGIPDGNKRYNVLFVFYPDPHDYRPAILQLLDDAAKERLDELDKLDDVDDVNEYLEDNHAMSASDFKDRLS